MPVEGNQYDAAVGDGWSVLVRGVASELVNERDIARVRGWGEKTEEVGRETVEARLDAWQARIEALRIQVHLAGLDALDQAAAPLTRLEARLDHARDRLRELAQESKGVWTVLAQAYESAREELAAGTRLVQERVSADSK